MFLIFAYAIYFVFLKCETAVARGDEGGVEPKPKNSFGGLSVEEFEFDIAIDDQSITLESWDEGFAVGILANIQKSFILSCDANERFPCR